MPGFYEGLIHFASLSDCPFRCGRTVPGQAVGMSPGAQDGLYPLGLLVVR